MKPYTFCFLRKLMEGDTISMEELELSKQEGAGSSVFEMDLSSFKLSDEQKFLFDLKGYLVIPGVFSEAETAAMREQVYKITHEPGNLAPHEKTVPGGASEVVLRNPVVKGALNALIGPDVRLDNQFVVWREKGMRDSQGPHQGGPERNPHFHYHVSDGQIYSALTRMVVELNPVGRRDGGTVFLPGSHKSNFRIPASVRTKRDDMYEPLFDAYECPAGSLIFFSENTCHAGPVWNNPDHPRVAILFAFNHIGCRWHRHHNVAPEVIEGLAPEARWYFRDIWPWDNNDKSGRFGGRNVVQVHADGSLTASP
ncbi:phytanoyl-CoA dioxygenase family protein [Paenibacillus mendelii]|uniref:Phytanoyl-CoA dioxygenase family protein n=1 Tax=Paenibacillus mendelii TaxID=206163 RepID=A0ABV6JG47_9BACL|nr:phytanoyl-CoA dioxygenase family protein [Paenibacillus mendelii]MCQ6561548.1 phytanoyl-CoA dioxygenase family protein [Paenibacillus mendelii]